MGTLKKFLLSTQCLCLSVIIIFTFASDTPAQENTQSPLSVPDFVSPENQGKSDWEQQAQEWEGQQTNKAEEDHYYYPMIRSVGFLRKNPLSPLGQIFKAKNDKIMISKRDEIYIRETRGDQPLIKGRYYTVYRISESQGNKKKRQIGNQYYLTGMVEIIRKESRFAVAVVTQSYRTIALGDFLMPDLNRKSKIALRESVNGLRGKIIISESGGDIMGEHSIVFIDKGEKDGVLVGQKYEIYYQEEAEIDPATKEKIDLSPIVLGNLIVLHTEYSTSSALIISSEKAIFPGTKIRAPNP